MPTLDSSRYRKYDCFLSATKEVGDMQSFTSTMPSLASRA